MDDFSIVWNPGEMVEKEDRLARWAVRCKHPTVTQGGTELRVPRNSALPWAGRIQPVGQSVVQVGN